MHDHGSVVKIVVIVVGHCALLNFFGSTVCVVTFVVDFSGLVMTFRS